MGAALAKREGRPSKYEPEWMPHVAGMFTEWGATFEDLAELLRVANSTVREWMKDYPEFSAAVKSGKHRADDVVERRLFERATGFEHDAVKIFNGHEGPTYAPYREKYAPDTTAAIFWLKNRRPEQWRDKREVEHSGDVNVTHRMDPQGVLDSIISLANEQPITIGPMRELMLECVRRLDAAEAKVMDRPVIEHKP